MKKLLAGFAAATLLVGCSSSTSTATAAATTEAAETTAPAEVEASSTLKVGVGSTTSISATDASEDSDGRVQVNTTFVGVAFDENDVIQYVWVDVAQNSGSFGTDGVITTDPETPTPSKKEKGDEYGMKKASGIGLEWYEQAEGFEAWAVGKTVSEVLGTPTEVNGSHTVATDADLLTTTTIGIDGFVAAFQAAVDNAVEVEGVASIATGSSTSMSFRDASEDQSGRVQSNVTYGIFALDAEGTVVFAQTDVAQQSGTFSTEGVADEPTVVGTKKEKGDEYGMKNASAIGLEWYEQNAGFEAWCVGKTLADILATPTEGDDLDADLLTTTTIGISGFTGAADAASNNVVALD